MLSENLDHSCAVGRRVLDWPGDASYKTDAVALRLAGALNALVLQEKSPELAAAYPPHENVDEAQLWQAVSAAFITHDADILHRLDSAPQTNEVRRTAAILPILLEIQQHFSLPLVLSELGASAGLNLNGHRYALNLDGQEFGDPSSPVRITPDWNGPLPPQISPQVLAKAGCDLNPLNPAQDSLHLLAYIWPDQTERISRTKAAIALAQNEPAPVARADARSWLENRLQTQHRGAVHVVFHTIAWQYFPPATQDACTAALQQAGQNATQDAPLAHVSMEADDQGEGAGLRATLWPGGQGFDLGRADFHGRWIRWKGFQGVNTGPSKTPVSESA